VPKIKNKELNYKCYIERGFTDGSSQTTTMQVTVGDFSTSIIQRDADGRAKINTPTTDLDGKYIVNKQYVEDNFVTKNTTIPKAIYAVDSAQKSINLPFTQNAT
jgi:hypothetical protein